MKMGSHRLDAFSIPNESKCHLRKHSHVGDFKIDATKSEYKAVRKDVDDTNL